MQIFIQFSMILVLLFSSMINMYQDAGSGDPSNHIYLPIVIKEYDPLWLFDSPFQVELSPAPFSKPYMVVDSSGRPHILWDTYSSNQYYIFHSYLKAGSWTNPTPISQTLGRSELLSQPVVGKNNQIYLIWRNTLNSGGPYRIIYSAWDGSRWEPEQELLGDGKTYNNDALIRLNGQGIPNVAFIQSNDFLSSSLFYRQWTGSGFSPAQEVTRPPNASIVWLDSDNGLHFYGDDYYDNALIYSYWKNGRFEITAKTIPGNKISLRKTFLDGQNNLHLVRSGSVPVPGGHVSGLSVQCMSSGFLWSKEQVISGENAIQNYSMSYNNMLQPIVAWSRNDNQIINVTFWNGCQLIKLREVSLPVVETSSGWGEFITVTENTQKKRVCLLSREKYRSSSFLVTCTRE